MFYNKHQVDFESVLRVEILSHSNRNVFHQQDVEQKASGNFFYLED